MCCSLLSVSDFQGFESYRPSEPSISSLPQHHHHHPVGASTLSSSVLNDSHIPFSCPACNFCQLDTATPFGSRLIHSFGRRSFNTATFSPSTTTSSATAQSDTLLSSGPASTDWHRCDNYLPACPARRTITFIWIPRQTRLSSPSASPIHVSKTSLSNGLIFRYFATSEAGVNN